VETFISDWKSIVNRLEQSASVLAEKSILREPSEVLNM
jgi:hypothetical protein